MATYVYRRNKSQGARELAEALTAIRFRGRDIPMDRKVRAGDIVVCWGESLPNIQGVRILNGAPIRSKFEDAIRLKEKGVATIEVSRTRPAPVAPVRGVDPAVAVFRELQEMAEDFADIQLPGQEIPRQGPIVEGLRQFGTALERLRLELARAVPMVAAPVNAEWLGRENDHVGGDDLLDPTEAPDYFARKEVLTREFRVHSFKGRSLRAGVKVPREGVAQHPWIRSWDGGWRISYDGVTSTQAHRDLAHAAVKALGLDFGAVDIGEKADGSLIVLEVNRAPGLEGGTITKYAEAVRGWINGDDRR